jgi:hypothetical protein
VIAPPALVAEIAGVAPIAFFFGLVVGLALCGRYRLVRRDKENHHD